MEKFAFVIHPLEARRDIARKYPFVKLFPESAVEWALKYTSPMLVSHITGIKSPTGAEAEGWFVGCPLTPHQLLTLPKDYVWDKLVRTCEMGRDLGAKIVGLGAFTSVVGDGGITVAQKLTGMAVTTGNSYTVATAIQGAMEGARMMDVDLASAQAAVVGATGSIGKTCAKILAGSVGQINLVGRNEESLKEIAREIGDGKADVKVFTDVHTGIKGADIIVTVTSAIDAVIHPADLKPGAVVCDVARPRDVSVRVAQERDDVLVIEGGVVAVPGDVNFNFNFGFPPQTAYACMSETMILALEGRYENFTLGKDVSVEQVEEISALADKHGFKLAGFRSFEKSVSPEKIEQTRENAKRKLAVGGR